MAERVPGVTHEETDGPLAKRFVDGEQAVARIKALGETARAAWFVLLGYLAFVGTTLLGVRDIDFFSVTASTQLPLVGISIPTMTFFLTAPILGAALHVYLHLYLVKLWDALAEAPPLVDDVALGDRVFPWLVIDWALRLRPDQATETRPLDRLGNWIMAAIVWLAGPIVLGLFWWQSATARDPWLTLVIAAAFGISLYTSFRGWRRARARLRHAGRTPPRPPRWRIRLWRWIVLPVALVPLAATSWFRTEGGLDYYADHIVAVAGPRVGLTFENLVDDEGNPISEEDVRLAWVVERFPTLASFSLLGDEGKITWTPLAPINLVDVEIAARPADWLGRDTAERRFRVDWCSDRGLPADSCAPPHAPYRRAAREAWCEDRPIDDCPDTFQVLDASFAREWAEQRAGYLANIFRPNLSGRDLRYAAVIRAFLAGVDLRGARLEGANLRRARLDGANLWRARLEGAILARAKLGKANLYQARLEGANLREARLEGTYLIEARLESANLVRAQLEGANLSRARLRGVNFVEARLKGANLSRARLDGAHLCEAQFQLAEWTGAIFGPLPAHSADLARGKGLIQSQLAHVIGDDTTVLPLDAETGRQLHVWACWEQEVAEEFVLLFAQNRNWLNADEYMQRVRERAWICAEGMEPLPVLGKR